MFNTATVVGVGVNIHGAGFPRNFVASFSEGGTAGFTDVQLTKFYAIAEKMMARRGRTFNRCRQNHFRSYLQSSGTIEIKSVYLRKNK